VSQTKRFLLTLAGAAWMVWLLLAISFATTAAGWLALGLAVIYAPLFAAAVLEYSLRLRNPYKPHKYV
jgi:hypothetical protein